MVLPVLIICASLFLPAAFAAAPLYISGHVTLNGVPVKGAIVTAGSARTTTDSLGAFNIAPMVNNGSSVTVLAYYEGNTAQTMIGQFGQGSVTINLDIRTTTETATTSPTEAPTETPTTTITDLPITVPTPMLDILVVMIVIIGSAYFLFTRKEQ